MKRRKKKQKIRAHKQLTHETLMSKIGMRPGYIKTRRERKKKKEVK